MTDYIAHFGIKGMKCGVRRYQNEDGSYTQAGKLRYNKNGNIRYANGATYINSSSNALGYKDFSPEVTTEVDRLHAKSVSILGEHWDRYAKKKSDEVVEKANKISRSEQALKEGMTELKKDFVNKDQVDDLDFLEMACDDIAYNVIRQALRKDSSISGYDEELNEWFDDCKNTVNMIVGDMGDTIVAEKGNIVAKYKDVVYSTLLDAQIVGHAHAARHGLIEETLGTREDFDSDYLAKRLYDEFMK